MAITSLTDVAMANDRYRATLRSTWIADPADTTLSVTAIPTNVPTYVTVGWGTDYETLFLIEDTSGTSSADYALTGVTRIKGANDNIPENTAVNCLNHEEFFNQYEEKINDIIDEINDALDEIDVALAVFEDPTIPDTDQTALGLKASFTAGETLAFGSVCYIKSDGKAWKADADAIATSSAVVLALAAISADAAGSFLLLGFARNDSWSWTVGGLLYLSTTAGAITQTPPSATDDVIQILGIATHADRLYWNPQLSQVEHT